MSRLPLVLLGIVVCVASLGAADPDGQGGAADLPSNRFAKAHPNIPPLPDISLSTEEIDQLPEEFAGTWWMEDKNFQIATVTRRSYQTTAHETSQDNSPPRPFLKVLKYKTADGSLMVRVVLNDHPGYERDAIYRFIPKNGVVVNYFTLGNKKLTGAAYMTIR